MRRVLFLFCVMMACAAAMAAKWQLGTDGSIVLAGEALSGYSDHVEMSGKRVSVVLRYGVAPDGSLVMNKSMVWPLLRTIPNNTHASLMRRFAWDAVRDIVVMSEITGEDRTLRLLPGTLDNPECKRLLGSRQYQEN